MQAKQHLDESLRMERSLSCVTGITLTLLRYWTALGKVLSGRMEISSKLSSKLPSAVQCSNVSVILAPCRDHPDIAAILDCTGQVSLQAGDLKQAKQHLDESPANEA